jgi:hypothetical protein
LNFFEAVAQRLNSSYQIYSPTRAHFTVSALLVVLSY